MRTRGLRLVESLAGMLVAGFLSAALLLPGVASAQDPVFIFTYGKVTESVPGLGTPLGCVELTTTDHRVFRSDANGILAINEPGLMDEKVYLRARHPNHVGGFVDLAPAGWQKVLEPGARINLTLDQDFRRLTGDPTGGGMITVVINFGLSLDVPILANDDRNMDGLVRDLIAGMKALHGIDLFTAGDGVVTADVWQLHDITTDIVGLNVDEPGVAPACDEGDEDSRHWLRFNMTPPVVTGPADYFRIQVIDAASGRGVPLISVLDVEKGETYWTDNNGLVAFHDLDRMNTLVEFKISGEHGYEAPDPDTFEISAAPDTTEVVSLNRKLAAERLYRVTGGGLYADSTLLAESNPLQNPNLNALTLGLDAGQAVEFDGKLHWIWGDSFRTLHPIGNLQTTGGTSDLPGLDPSIGIDIDFYEETRPGFQTGHTYPIAPVTNFRVQGPNDPKYVVWFDKLLTMPDPNSISPSGESLFAGYTVVPGLQPPVETGVAKFDLSTPGVADLTQHVERDPTQHLVLHTGKPTRFARGDDAQVYFVPHRQSFENAGDPNAHVSADNPTRMVDSYLGLTRMENYEAFTPLETVMGVTDVAQDADNRPIYEWRKDELTISKLNGTETLIAESKYRLYGHFRDPDDGEFVKPHLSSMQWNPHRERFVDIFTEWNEAHEPDESLFGEVWYAEADTPVGPWVYARKIVTHDNYSFYLPYQHEHFMEGDGQKIYFEGTYTDFKVEDVVVQTPKHNYNQFMYRLDLDDPSLNLPVAIYDTAETAEDSGQFATRRSLTQDTEKRLAAFFAHESGSGDTIPVAPLGAACRGGRLVAGTGASTHPALFYALPFDHPALPLDAIPLWEYANGASGDYAYSTDPGLVLPPGYTRANDPLVHVFDNPIDLYLPVGEFLTDVLADAGSDVCTTEPSVDATISVGLNGSLSSEEDGTITLYEWSWSGGTATGATPSIDLPRGEHVITLTATGSSGETRTDTVIVDVEPADNDADGVYDFEDNCVGVANGAQLDGDADGVGDLCDNCIDVANTDQRDTDTDQYGDLCDADFGDADNICGQADFMELLGEFGNDCNAFPTLTCDTDLSGDNIVGSPDFVILTNRLGLEAGPSAFHP